MNEGPGTNAQVEDLRFTLAEIWETPEHGIDVLVALGLINHEIRSKSSEGLPRFVDRFDQMGYLRDTALDDVRADIVRESCAAVFASDQIVAAEFRKTLAVGRRYQEAEGKLRQSLCDHILGFAAFAEKSGRSCRVSMPITFARELPNGAPAPDELTSYYRLRSLWAVWGALLSVRSSCPQASSFVTGVDVVGNELSTTNWPFVPIFDAMSRDPDFDGFSRTVHAGEFFRWRMQGLRSIGELVLPTRVVDRIGHCLALDDDLPNAYADPAISFRDAVEDLCWLATVGIDSATVEGFLARIVEETRMASFDVDVGDLLCAWTQRRTIDGLASEDVVGRNPRTLLEAPLESRPASHFYLGTGRTRALLALIYRGSGPLNLLDHDAGLTGSEYLSWARGIAPVVAEMLRERLATEGVVVESCPTSNLTLSRMNSLSEHPIARFIDAGLAVSLSSDDPIVFGTSISQEAAKISSVFGEDVLRSVAATSTSSCCPGAMDCGPSDAAALRSIVRDELGREYERAINPNS